MPYHALVMGETADSAVCLHFQGGAKCDSAQYLKTRIWSLWANLVGNLGCLIKWGSTYNKGLKFTKTVEVSVQSNILTFDLRDLRPFVGIT